MITPRPTSDSDATRRLLAQVQAGQATALSTLLARHRAYLRQVVELYLDPRLRQRVDPSDIVQEAQLEATRRMDDYLARPALAFRLWLRRIAYDRLLMLRRRHHGAQRRALAREAALPEQSTARLGQQLLDDGTSPSAQAVGGELARRVRQALLYLPVDDRELLLLRNFEGLSNLEVAELLGLEPAAASKRYGRALLRLRARLVESGLAGSQP